MDICICKSLLVECHGCGRHNDVTARKRASAHGGVAWSNFTEAEDFDVFEIGGGNVEPCILEAICEHDGRTALITRND